MTDQIDLTNNRGEIDVVSIDDELKSNYLAYAMSVIVGRALPDVRDGLKPVHRRILYAMSKIRGCDTRTVKSARIVGDVIGKYHPHGDAAAYDALVRLAQPFNMRYVLADGQGNFGTIDGDPAAAQRYTEAKLSKLAATDVLCDLDKDTVDFMPNFDGTEQEPMVLPTRIPLLLVNGSNGIAVGMATNIPPHNLGEIIDGMIYQMRHPDCTTRDLMQFIKGPDFPTYGTIIGKRPIYEAYETGQGKIRVRAKVEEEKVHGHDALIVKELPYQVNKARLLTKIAALVKEKRIEGIHDLRDESGKAGIRMVIEIKKDYPPQVVLNHLYKLTDLQTTFGVIMLAVVNNKPEILSLKQVLAYFIEFRRDVVVRRTIYLLRQARDRAHILEGYVRALDHLDEVISIIRGSQTAQEASEQLIARFEFSEVQTKAILELRLQRLTGMERDKILDELAEKHRMIGEYEAILASKDRIDQCIIDEIEPLKKVYADTRRTEIVDGSEEDEIMVEDLIVEEYVMVMRTKQNYIKRMPLTEYQAQKRGGAGKRGMVTKDDDYVLDLFASSTHQRILVFTSLGRVFQLKAFELPQGSRNAKGRPIINMLPKLEQGENVETILPIPMEHEENRFIVMVTENGVIKKTKLDAFDNIRKTGIRAISFREGDRLVSARIVKDEESILLTTERGMSCHFSSKDIRDMGRASMGVCGMKFKYDGDKIISMEIIDDENGKLLCVTANGYGKRTEIKEYRLQKRGGTGIKAINTDERNGNLVAAMLVYDDAHLLVATDSGTIIRTRVSEIRETGRTAAGVKIMRTGENEHVVAVARIKGEDESEDDNVVVSETASISDVPADDDVINDVLLDASEDLDEVDDSEEGISEDDNDGGEPDDA
ncbi:MAG: DNA gyrase subunit A [Proteobacteria bacterium]|nr:DNA gyrase subunit A [Pseudomonadota bacterium]